MTYADELKTAIEAVKHASLVCQSVQSGMETDALEKADRSPVTVADFGSQAVICRALKAAFPDDPVIAEEDAAALRDNPNMLEQVAAEVRRQVDGAAPDSICGWIDRGNAAQYTDRFWTLDPIDGTKGFLRGEQYAVALALLVDGRVEVAALACPNLPDASGQGVVFGAHRGEGTFRIPLSGSETRTPVHVSTVSLGAEARFCESVESAHSSHSDAATVADMLGIVKEPLRIDSQAKYAVVARGDAEIYLRLTKQTGYVEKIWDHASGALVIEEAGGRVTDLHGRRLDFTRGIRLERNIGIVATNGHMHDLVLDALHHTL